MTAMAEQLLDVVSRAHSYLFQALRAMSDDDSLLRIALNNNCAVDPREILAHFFPLFRDDRGDVRDFFASLFENLFAHNLGSNRAERLIGEFVFGENGSAFRQVADDFSQQLFK